MNILVVDDNKQICSILKEYAHKEGYRTVEAFDGAQALEKFEQENPDIVLLDVMMPKKDGFEVCREIRRISNVPIMMLTARKEDFEKIMGLEIGADDYIVKPFSPGEVMARIKAILRRIARDEKEQLSACFGTLCINLENYTVRNNGQEVPLTKKEIELLWTLASNKSKVFTRENLLDLLWGYDYYGDTRTVDSHIKRLRAKLGEDDAWEIKTIWGVGYKFEVKA